MTKLTSFNVEYKDYVIEQVVCINKHNHTRYFFFWFQMRIKTIAIYIEILAKHQFIICSTIELKFLTPRNRLAKAYLWWYWDPYSQIGRNTKYHIVDPHQLRRKIRFRWSENRKIRATLSLNQISKTWSFLAQLWNIHNTCTSQRNKDQQC